MARLDFHVWQSCGLFADQAVPLLITMSQGKKSLQMPPPLQIPPSRARRQFAMRLAQRKAELEASKEQAEEMEADEETQQKEVKEGHERFAKMFEGIEDDSSSEDEGEPAKPADEKAAL
ncbi:hypothetical protein BS50DRAFT_159001 [Corynespora cassiicola Philippines]|uniref:Uncharacterized protein n=1 Tax=Corynespora cassiicola Philippines TaxID=1448308 RepID=A0A2T2N640_CORCC|nr:hypothetical protein BS50DRAFT_159001 [Corynespora cassiicola Philippines]